MTEAGAITEVQHPSPLSFSIGWRRESTVYSRKADAGVPMTLKETERIANVQICKRWCYEIEAGAIFRLMLL